MTVARFAPALVLLCAASALAQDRFIRHYHERVALFERENRGLSRDDHVVLVGDSLTEGWKHSRRVERYLPSLAPRVLNRGISADRVGAPRGVLSRMGPSIFDTRPAAVVLLVGVNQIHRDGSGIPGAARHYEEIVRQVRARLPRVRLLCVTTPPARGRYDGFTTPIRTYNRLVAEIAARHGAELLDLHRLFRDSSGRLRQELSSDGLHFNSEGYRIYGAALERHLASPAQPATPPAPLPLAGLQRGDRGAAVEALQQALNDQRPAGSAPLQVDGSFGPATETALRAFQTAAGLPASGVVDAATEARLRPAATPAPSPGTPAPSPAPPAPTPPGSSGGVAGALGGARSGLTGLARGSSGVAVEQLQRALNARGASLSADGRFGRLTEAALRRFQASEGLPETGRVDAATAARLSGSSVPAARPPQSELARGSSGVAVEQLQRALNARGASLSVDGEFGRLTEAALRRFQAGVGLPESGRLDDATAAQLR